MNRISYFTLVELMVVGLVSCLMATLAVSTVAKLSDRDKGLICKQNLVKFGKATRLYAADSGGYLPFPGILWTGKNYLGKGLNAYLSNSEPSKDPGIFACPADARKMSELQEGGSKFWMQTPEGKWAYYRVSYGINLIVSGIPKNQYWKPHQLSKMANPGRCYLYADAVVRDNPGVVKRFAFRHSKQANIVNVDGHIATLTEDNIPAWKSDLNQPFWVGGK